MRSLALHLFQGLADSYDRTVDVATFFQDRYWKKWATQRAEIEDGGLVLDLGCGTLLMEERLPGFKCRFVGIDITKEMVRVGIDKGLPNVALVVGGDAESLPFPDETFDSVISCYVTKYVSIPKLAKELARVAKPGATVVLYDFVKPKGILAPFLELYIQGGLRAMGYLLRLTKKTAAFAFDNLPRIIDGATWDKEIVKIMEGRGIETAAAETLTGGVVFAYCGRKPVRSNTPVPSRACGDR
jgi:demethylmenaquinone methyltransferase/2-methoxy-6-polyprenyl-1,4-benzoquinol methylase